MSDVVAEMGLPEAAIHRYTGSKEDLFVPAIRHSREFVAEAVPVRALFPASAVAAGGR